MDDQYITYNTVLCMYYQHCFFLLMELFCYKIVNAIYESIYVQREFIRGQTQKKK